MSLRRRLLWLLSAAFTGLWLSVAALMYLHLDQQVSRTLDQRLAASATMVAGLIASQPQMLLSSRGNSLLVTPETEGVACQITAASGEVLLETSGVRKKLLSDARPGFSTRDIGGQQWRLYSLKQNGNFITTADRMSERNALANSIVLVMVVPFFLALLGGLVVLWWGIRRVLMPLQSLHEQLLRRTPENLDAIQLEHAPTELASVVSTLNSLLGRVAGTVAWEKRFANNAAHEFRTPLTAVKTHLQVAGRLTGERQQQALANAEMGVQRLQTVTEQLLMLSRSERQVAPSDEDCSVNEIIEQVQENLSYSSRIRLHYQCTNHRIRLPAQLAVVVVHNLVDNALKHSNTVCEVLVERVHDGTPDGVPLTKVLFRDAGMTTKFHGKPDARIATPESHGLGLNIVKTILAQYGGSLTSTRNKAGGMDWLLCVP